MSLTGVALQVVEVILLLAGAGGLVVGWNLLAGSGWWRIVARAGGLVLVNLLVLVTAATALNNQYLFFADWQDLSGALGDGNTSTPVQAGGGAAAAAEQHAAQGTAAVPAASLPPLPEGSDPAKPITFTVSGPASGITSTVVVLLPPGYTDAAQQTTRYPVLETFSGYPSNPQQWVGTMGLGTALAARVDAGKLRHPIVVSPQAQVPPGRDTECVNGAKGNPQLETWLTVDVPAWVAKTFRVSGDRASWATIGLSTGGWCAAMAALLHPAQYSAAIVLGGYFRPEFSAQYEPYPPSSALAARYDLVALAKRDAPPVAIWVETSHSDPVSYSTTAAFLKAAHKPTAVNAVVLQHAGHRIDLWKGYLPQVLDWLGANIPGFAHQ